MKNLNIKKYSYIALAGVLVLGLLYVTVRTSTIEVGKYTKAWKEIQFAKDHPVLVQHMREQYEVGLQALDKVVMEGNVISPIPEPSKASR